MVAVLLLMILAAAMPAAEPPSIQQVLPFDTTACFAADDVGVDPAGAPAQPLTHLRLGMRASWNIGAGRDRPFHEIFVSIQAASRDGGSASLLGYCSDYERDDLTRPLTGLICDLACVGDAVAVDAVDTDTIAISSRGLRANCHEPWLDGTVDTTFHLRRQFLAACAELEALPVDEAGIEAAYRRSCEQAGRPRSENGAGFFRCVLPPTPSTH